MRSKRVVRVLGIALVGVAAIAAFGGVVLQLWNWLMPAVFGMHAITFWQALGLLALSWILFGGRGRFRGPGYSRHWRHRMAERLEKMPPEQREQFRESLKRRCGLGDVPSAEPKG